MIVLFFLRRATGGQGEIRGAHLREEVRRMTEYEIISLVLTAVELIVLLITAIKK